jgi:hypothetical protein
MYVNSFRIKTLKSKKKKKKKRFKPRCAYHQKSCMSRSDAKIQANDPPSDAHSSRQSGNPHEELGEFRMIGDFDGNANALWSLYGKEAKSYDEARIQTLKHDMDGVLIFVRPCFV